jgi:nicotinamidase-related amidase
MTAAEPTASTGLTPGLTPEFGRSALLVIDMQNDFAEGGSTPVAGTRAVTPAVARLAAAYRQAARPVIHAVRLYDGGDVDRVRRQAIADGARIVRPGTRGSQVIAGLLPAGAPELDPKLLLAGDPQVIGADECVLWKPRWSAFYRTDLHAQLITRKVTTLVVAGCNFPNCPRAALFDASERDYRVVMVTDAISGVTDNHIDESRRLGVVPLTAAAVLAALAALTR